MADPAPVLLREVDALIQTQITILNQATPFLRNCSTPKGESTSPKQAMILAQLRSQASSRYQSPIVSFWVP
jgi:hypothetical protein